MATVVNPTSGRSIQIGAGTFKKLIAGREFVYDPTNNVLKRVSGQLTLRELNDASKPATFMSSLQVPIMIAKNVLSRIGSPSSIASDLNFSFTMVPLPILKAPSPARVITPAIAQPMKEYVPLVISSPLNKLETRDQPAQGCAHGIQGRRPTMEDEHVYSKQGKWEFFAVFDGHGGAQISKTLVEELPGRVLAALQTVNEKDGFAVRNALEATFLKMDEDMYEKHKSKSAWGADPGSTAIVMVRSGNAVYLANVGDSRAILFDDNGKLVAYTKDHKPSEEKERIEKAGGTVSHYGVDRVNGVLATSRAFGDFQLKKLKNVGAYTARDGPVSTLPDVYQVILRNDQKVFAILACDGLWDVFNNETVASMSTTAQGDLCKLLTQAAYDAGSTDNISVLFTRL